MMDINNKDKLLLALAEKHLDADIKYMSVPTSTIIRLLEKENIPEKKFIFCIRIATDEEYAATGLKRHDKDCFLHHVLEETSRNESYITVKEQTPNGYYQLPIPICLSLTPILPR